MIYCDQFNPELILHSVDELKKESREKMEDVSFSVS